MLQISYCKKNNLKIKQGPVHGIISHMLLGRGTNIIDLVCFVLAGLMDQPTDQPTDNVTYRVAYTGLKKIF